MDRGQRGGYARAATAAALSGADILARGRGECIRSLLGRFTAAGLDLSLSRGLYTPAISYAPSGYCGFFLALSCCRRPLWFRRAVGSYISAPLCRPPLHIFRGETGRGLWRVFLRGDSGLYKRVCTRDFACMGRVQLLLGDSILRYRWKKEIRFAGGTHFGYMWVGF